MYFALYKKSINILKYAAEGKLKGGWWRSSLRFECEKYINKSTVWGQHRDKSSSIEHTACELSTKDEQVSIQLHQIALTTITKQM